MIAHIDQLQTISRKQTRKIIGLMSGTSLDGLDIALCAVTGNGKTTKIELENFITVEYNDDLKSEVKEIFSNRKADLEKVCLLNEWIGIQHAEMINATLRTWNLLPAHIDLVASHGQTIYHAPIHQHQRKKFGNATLQIGDGDHIAMHTGIITMSDFRQKHIAAGGEGAPLAAYGDLILFGDAQYDTLLLNIGGIANFTFLPSSEKNKFFSTDIGPGNTLMDSWMQKNYPGEYFDKDALIAKQGIVNTKLLNALKDHAFFDIPFPKTTGPELFSAEYLDDAINSIEKSMTVPDVMATLNAFTASVICDSIQKIERADTPLQIYLSGGGMHNPLVTNYIRQSFPKADIRSTADKNINPDAKEAILFAILANECVAGERDTFADLFPNVSMGKISFPS